VHQNGTLEIKTLMLNLEAGSIAAY